MYVLFRWYECARQDESNHRVHPYCHVKLMDVSSVSASAVLRYITVR